MTKWSRKRSIWVFHVNAASCNGCDIEILAALTPRYDAERLGVQLVGSPRHADVLLVTGTVNPMTRDVLKRIYEQMPEPRLVVAVGACALGGGVMKGCYNVGHGIDKVIPVNLFIPGCPPRPEALLYGILKLVGEEPKTEPVVNPEQSKELE
ncbi:MAG: NADH-quinone oxidoreductase subunit B family protein [Thaumarchaeota archaeon]|nr:NADH-quinone oxidoreductase subunit B family protein [Nitrososphaerota archaeon]